MFVYSFYVVLKGIWGKVIHKYAIIFRADSFTNMEPRLFKIIK